MTPTLKVDKTLGDEGEWRFMRWSDGNEQVCLVTDRYRSELFIERVDAPKSRRKRWRVVSRKGLDNDTCYPPALSPPFKDLDAAKVAYLIALASGAG